MASLTSLRSNIGPPFFTFQHSPALSSTVVCGTFHDLSKVSYLKLSPYISMILSVEEWKEAMTALSLPKMHYLFCKFHTLLILVLPTDSSRHNSPSRPHFLTDNLALTSRLVHSKCLNILLVTSKTFSLPLSAAVAKAFPIFSMRNDLNLFDVFLEFCLSDDNENMDLKDRQCLAYLSDGIRRAQQIVDSPANIMDTDGFLVQIQQVHESLKSFDVTLSVIEGEELQLKGFGGIYGVGKQATSGPKFVVLSYAPNGADQIISLVGKGIVYDTGGLSLKPKGFMAGMKRDCGGAAAVLGAFYTLVNVSFAQTLHAIFCLAENAIGPIATRPDDIHTLYSGKTVEINNPDAEGRLVLGDGVAYADVQLKSNIIIDLATLTGAQGSTTGRFHAAILSNSANWESMVMKAGRISGDCAFPIVYCPELHYSEFDSKVADMKNSVANYNNATSSCAGLFIASHLSPNFSGSWIHIDMAATVASGERATGFGVSLLVGLLGKESKSDYLNYICASIVP